MRDLRWLALLLLALPPVPAAASAGTPAGGDGTACAAVAADGGHLRAGPGPRLAEACRLREAELGTGGAAAEVAGPPPASAPLAAGRAAPAPPAGSVPLCQRLPYHATAPPRRR